MRSQEAPLFGEITESSVTADSCTFRWSTGHPVDHSGTAVVGLGKTVTLHGFRDAEFTLDNVSPAGCALEEFLPRSP